MSLKLSLYETSLTIQELSCYRETARRSILFRNDVIVLTHKMPQQDIKLSLYKNLPVLFVYSLRHHWLMPISCHFRD